MADREKLPDLTGQLVLLNLGVASTKDRGVEAWLLEYPQWRSIGGRLFLVGRMPKVFANEWIAGREVSVAWEHVSSFVTFESQEQYREHASRHKPSFRERFLR